MSGLEKTSLCLIFFAILCLTFVGCDELNKTGYEQQFRRTKSRELHGISRFYDKKHNVVCYKLYNDSISCIKLEEK